MKKFCALALGFALALVLAAPAVRAADEAKKDDGKEQKIELDKVPAAVKAAAEKAVKGVVLTEAEVETKDGVTIYSFDGKADGKEYDIEVTADGKVLKAEEDKEAGKEEKDGEKKEKK